MAEIVAYKQTFIDSVLKEKNDTTCCLFHDALAVFTDERQCLRHVSSPCAARLTEIET